MSEVKYVRYNGEKESYYSCTVPKRLEKGKIYEVISISDRGYQTDYTLKGIEGRFNSAWFDEVDKAAGHKPTVPDIHEINVYRARSQYIPKVGERYRCCRWEPSEDEGRWQGVITSTVKEVICVEEGKRYKVITQNSKYLVKII